MIEVPGEINTFVFPIIRTDMIRPALRSLWANTPPNHKAIVVNQSNSDSDTDKAIHSLCDVHIKTKLNYGFAQAANLGARLATTEYVTICNDDVLFFWPGWWRGIVDTFAKYDNALGVLPLSPKEPGWGYGEDGYRMHATLEECKGSPEVTVERLKSNWNGAVIDGAAMWCITFKRQEWADLGMFDERFCPGGGEDYDASARAYIAGYRILSSSLSWVWHHWGQSKDEPTGFDTALPVARPGWNKLSTKGFGDEGIWHPDCDVWGKGCERTDPNVYRAPL